MACEMISVDSSLLEEVGYEEEIEQLTVIFRKTGGTYLYFGVRPEIYEAMMAAGFVGSYFVKNIKDKFRYREV